VPDEHQYGIFPNGARRWIVVTSLSDEGFTLFSASDVTALALAEPPMAATTGDPESV